MNPFVFREKEREAFKIAKTLHSLYSMFLVMCADVIRPVVDF